MQAYKKRGISAYNKKKNFTSNYTLKEFTNNIKLILNLTLIAPALKVLSITVKLTISLYTKYWLNLVVNAFTAFILIIILYYLLKLY